MKQWVINFGGPCDPNLPCFRNCYQRKTNSSLITIQQLAKVASLIDIDGRRNNDALVCFHVNGGTPLSLVAAAYYMMVADRQRSWGVTVNSKTVRKLIDIEILLNSTPMFSQGSWTICEDTRSDYLEMALTGYTFVLPKELMEEDAVRFTRQKLASIERLRRECCGNIKPFDIYLLAEHGGPGCTSVFDDDYRHKYDRVMKCIEDAYLVTPRSLIRSTAPDLCVCKRACQAAGDVGRLCEHQMYNVIRLDSNRISIGGCPWNGEIRCHEWPRGIYAVESHLEA